MDTRPGRELPELKYQQRVVMGGAERVASPAAAASAARAATAATLTVARAATAATLTVALALTVACWFIAIRMMSGMDMGVATQPGSFVFFITVWVLMMAAMMLPGAVPAVARTVHPGRLWAVPLFAGTYLVIWALAGGVVYLLDRPHGAAAAGAVVIAAGAYELTPLKQHFRRRCRERTSSGLRFGLCCASSSIGLMAMLAALGVMSITWMAVVTVLVTAQKLLPPKTVLDLPLALAIIGFGVLIMVAPATVPGLMPPM